MVSLLSLKPVQIMTCLLVVTAAGIVLIGGTILMVCVDTDSERAPGTEQSEAIPPLERGEELRFAEARRAMVEKHLLDRGIADVGVLAAMGRVPREQFVPTDYQQIAYRDSALPVGHGQTISQPYIVALMTEAAGPTAISRALEIGTGTGYQTAVLAALCKEVFSIEIVKPLADAAGDRLAALGYKNVTIRCGDGYRGWPEHAPFDVIVVTAAPDRVPQTLVDQLAPGGRLVIPVGHYFQDLTVLEKLQDGTIRRKTIAMVAFVPMTGEPTNDSRE